MTKKTQIDEILEVVLFIKDRLIGAEKKIDSHHEEIVGKLGGVNQRIDNEVDHRKALNVRVGKLEKKVFK